MCNPPGAGVFLSEIPCHMQMWSVWVKQLGRLWPWWLSGEIELGLFVVASSSSCCEVFFG